MSDIIDIHAHLIGTPANGVNLYQVPNASMEVLEDVINATWNLALTKSDAVTAKVTAATADNALLDPDLAPTASAGTVVVPTIDEPLVDIPASASVNDVFLKFNDEYPDLAAWLVSQFTYLHANYFSDYSIFVGAINPSSSPTAAAGAVAALLIDEPLVDLPASASVDDIFLKFNTEYPDLATWLVSQFTAYKTNYFSDYASFVGAVDPDAPPTATAGTVSVPVIDEPLVNIPADATVVDVFDTLTQEYPHLATWLVAQFTDYLTDNAPTDAASYAAAGTWLTDALGNPEVGLPPGVADQIWTDGRDRITSDAARAQADVLELFASKRFPLPPGAAANAAIKIQQKAQDEIAESSRKVAMVSVEIQKWTVEKLVMMHDAVMKNAVEYVRALASGPDMVSRMVGIGYDAQQKLISSVASFYNARTQAKDVMSKVAQYNNSITFDASKANQAGELSVLDKVVALRNAAMQGAADYSKTLASAPDIISKMSGIGYDAQSKLISSTASYYNARTQAKEAESKVLQYNNTIDFESAKANQASTLEVLKMVVSLRKSAMQDTVDYIKAMATSPDTISRMSGIGYDAQSKLISSASQYYNARTQATEAVSKVTQYNNSIAFDSAKANQASKVSVTEMNLKALLADISSIAQQATAALNNLHVGVTMQAGGSTITTQAQVDVPGT